MPLSFNKKFYPLSAIKRAIRAYQGLATFEIKENKNYFEINIEGVDQNLKEILKDEFSNYVLAETKKFR